MAQQRKPKIDSLLLEVLSEVIQREVQHPKLPPFTSISKVDISADFRLAKVYITTVGDRKLKEDALEALKSAAGFISVSAAKKVSLRFFPKLLFIIDDSAEKEERIALLFDQIATERENRKSVEEP